jgi:hypothetical protein
MSKDEEVSTARSIRMIITALLLLVGFVAGLITLFSGPSWLFWSIFVGWIVLLFSLPSA